MKRLIIKLVSSLHPINWESNKSYKILVQINNYFSIEKWEMNLAKHFHAYNQSEIIYSRNKFITAKLLKDADFCFLWGLSRYVDLRNSQVKFIYFGTSGLDFLNSIYIPKQITISNPKQIASEAIAEYTLAVALMAHRKLHVAIKNQNKCKWDQNTFLSTKYVSISNKIIGVMGVGNNGKLIARNFKRLGCRVYGFDKSKGSNEFIDKWYIGNELKSFLQNIDILIIALPLTQDTKHIINHVSLSYMKENSILINTSRGDIIKEEDLLVSLKSKKIQCAVLDVFSREPLKFWDKKWKNQYIVITPHIAGNINLFVDEIQRDFVHKLNKMVS
ncbi:NAD(P)-dependent oxidoreductase [Melioribacter sp. OK-6-Me]|uniref:NAD(P)-dependent oxidoreductase n=1 Tax=Melioribacter sp. OK-6-Me TaxID=3423433 RepID=UPI003ED9D45D